MERTLVLLKPDAVRRQLMGEIISRFEGKFRIEEMNMLIPTLEQARLHYTDHKGKDFFVVATSFLSSGPLVALILAGDNAIVLVRGLIGATDPKKAAIGTIRGDFGYDQDLPRNLVHASDSKAAVRWETGIWFPKLQ